MSKFTNDDLQNSMDKYSADYSESGFLDFVKRYGKKAGKTILERQDSDKVEEILSVRTISLQLHVEENLCKSRQFRRDLYRFS